MQNTGRSEVEGTGRGGYVVQAPAGQIHGCGRGVGQLDELTSVSRVHVLGDPDTDTTKGDLGGEGLPLGLCRLKIARAEGVTL